MAVNTYCWNLSICLLALALGSVSRDAQSESFVEMSLGATEHALDIVRKRGEDFADDTSAVSVAIGAYRQTSEKSAWGAVFEVSSAVGRDDDLPGSGRIVGLRPVNYLRHIGANVSYELYAGAAQYEWRKTANGLYFGGNLRYDFLDRKLALAVDVKYYQDLSFDSPEGDDIVDGFGSGVRAIYRF